MEIKIRNVDPFVVKTFDELAKKQSISRQGYHQPNAKKPR